MLAVNSSINIFIYVAKASLTIKRGMVYKRNVGIL